MKNCTPRVDMNPYGGARIYANELLFDSCRAPECSGPEITRGTEGFSIARY
jgi:hypothetical protein